MIFLIKKGNKSMYKNILASLTLLIVFKSTYLMANDQIPVEYFAKLPTFSAPELSPDGSKFAVRLVHSGEPIIIVQEFKKSGSEKAKPAVPIRVDDKHFISWFDWANEDKLIFALRTSTAQYGFLWNFTRIGSIGADGRGARFFKMEANASGQFRQSPRVIHKLPNDDDHMLMALDDMPNSWAKPIVHKINVSTGKREITLKNRIGAYNWISDYNGQVRIGIQYKTRLNQKDVILHYRENNKSEWEILEKADYFDTSRIVPHRFKKADDNILLVTKGELEDGKEIDDLSVTLYEYDLTTREIIGKHETSARRQSAISTVKKAFPDLKVKLVSSTKNRDKFFFKLYSDVNPPEYYLLDLDKKTLDYVASQYPQLEDKPLAPMSKTNYSARDGLNIPAFLTIPEGKTEQNLPTIIYPHGGPWSHDKWGFDNYVQFFASRGYAVFQPQFRGSTGLGPEHEAAGYKQWGYRIQDDITDGVKWLVKEGISDPDRICIVGSSFGGYAAAMGLAKTPELFKCGVSINGVLKLDDMLLSGRRLLFESLNRAVWNDMKDTDDVSPYALADNISSPLLLIASTRDTVVPDEHSKKMYSRLMNLDKDVEFVELLGGEHWRTNEKLELEKLKAVDKFLSKHLKTDDKQQISALNN